MIVSIHQPNFIPWLGFFHKLFASDVFVLFDDVQLPRGKSYVSRVQIKTPQGPGWLSVPVTGKGDLVSINEVETMPGDQWKRKLLKTVEINYAKAPFMKTYFQGFAEQIGNAGPSLCELNISLIEWVREVFNAPVKLVRSSQLEAAGDRGGDRIMSILQHLGATVYISGKGAGSRRYIDEDEFSRNGIALQWQEFSHPQYLQQHGVFAENLSIIDFLFNCGPEIKKITE